MFDFIWDTNGYFFWLLVVSIICWILERFFPWRKEQKAFRKQLGQDFLCNAFWQISLYFREFFFKGKIFWS